jgi:hypothetical protein
MGRLPVAPVSGLRNTSVLINKYGIPPIPFFEQSARVKGDFIEKREEI